MSHFYQKFTTLRRCEEFHCEEVSPQTCVSPSHFPLVKKFAVISVDVGVYAKQLVYNW